MLILKSKNLEISTLGTVLRDTHGDDAGYSTVGHQSN